MENNKSLGNEELDAMRSKLQVALSDFETAEVAMSTTLRKGVDSGYRLGCVAGLKLAADLLRMKGRPSAAEMVEEFLHLVAPKYVKTDA